MTEEQSVTPENTDIQNDVGDDVVTDVVDVDGGTDDAESTSSQPAIDWDSDDNPYKGRFTGLQGTVQQRTEERDALRAEIQRTQAEKLKQAIEDLPEDERNVAINEVRRQFEMSQVMGRVQTLEAEKEASAKRELAQHLASAHKVPMDELLEFNDPHSMARYAEKTGELLKKQRATEKKTERKTGQADRFEGSTTGATKKAEKARDIPGAKRQFAEALAKRLNTLR